MPCPGRFVGCWPLSEAGGAKVAPSPATCCSRSPTSGPSSTWVTGIQWPAATKWPLSSDWLDIRLYLLLVSHLFLSHNAVASANERLGGFTRSLPWNVGEHMRNAVVALLVVLGLAVGPLAGEAAASTKKSVTVKKHHKLATKKVH